MVLTFTVLPRHDDPVDDQFGDNTRGAIVLLAVLVPTKTCGGERGREGAAKLLTTSYPNRETSAST